MSWCFVTIETITKPSIILGWQRKINWSWSIWENVDRQMISSLLSKYPSSSLLICLAAMIFGYLRYNQKHTNGLRACKDPVSNKLHEQTCSQTSHCSGSKSRDLSMKRDPLVPTYLQSHLKFVWCVLQKHFIFTESFVPRGTRAGMTAAISF